MENIENKNFKQILDEYLNAYQEGGVEKIEELMRQYNLSDSATVTLDKADELLRKNMENTISLKNAKEDFIPTSEWFATKLGEIQARLLKHSK